MQQKTLVTLAAFALGCGACDVSPPRFDAGYVIDGTTEPPTEAASTGEVVLRTVYVPAYSYLSREPESKLPALLSILLSVRNIDSTTTITLSHVDYFDTSGHRVRRYLENPRQLKPLETIEFSVTTRDLTGGSGANFLVYWEGPSDAHALLAEAVMVSNMGPGYIAFTSRGIELDRRPDSDLFEAAEPGVEKNPASQPQ